MKNLFTIIFILSTIFSCKKTKNENCTLNSAKDQLFIQSVKAKINNNELNTAINNLENIISKDSTKSAYHNILGSVLFRQYKNLELPDTSLQQEIIKCFTKANILCPNDKYNLENLIESFYTFYRYEKSLAIAENYIKRYPANSLIYSRMADCYRELDNHNKSLQFATKGIEIDSTFALCYFLKAEAYNELDSFQQAIHFYEQALILEPNYYQYLYGLGRLYHNQKMKEKALDYYLKAYQFNSKDKTIAIAIGNIYSDFFQTEMACKYYQSAISNSCGICTPREVKNWRRYLRIIKEYCK